MGRVRLVGHDRTGSLGSATLVQRGQRRQVAPTDSAGSAHNALEPVLLLLGGAAIPDTHRERQDALDDRPVELDEDVLAEAKLPQLAKEVQALLRPLDDRVHVVVPAQVVGDGGAQELETGVSKIKDF